MPGTHADSGYTALPLAAGITAVATVGRAAPAYRKIGNQVHVVGGVSFPAGTSNVTIATLPVGYRPAQYRYYLAALTGTNVARLMVNPSGEIKVEWVYSLTGSGRVTGAMSWIDIDISFFIV